METDNKESAESRFFKEIFKSIWHAAVGAFIGSRELVGKKKKR